MKTGRSLTVGLPGREYDILIGGGLLGEVGELIKPLRDPDAAVAVVTDENVWRLYGNGFAASLSVSGIGFEPVISPAGEGFKSLDGLSRLYGAFAEMGLKRNGLVVAFGGGVTGDMGGFAAATWMRGVSYIQVPTTLLAQVDSSVGGKTAVNLPQGKNLVGAFYQPKLVVIDPLTLRTLPEREFGSGMAEVIKYGAIRSERLFGELTEKIRPDRIPDVIRECCRIKSEIVERDERDFGERMLLNFGHTFGHAIEKASGFGRYRHGEAVAFGMVMASDLGERAGLTAPGVGGAIRKVLAANGMDADYPGDLAELQPFITADKKSLGDGVQMVMLRRVGEAFVHRFAFSEINAFLAGREIQSHISLKGGLK